MSFPPFCTSAGPSLLCDGVRQRRRSHVSHPEVQKVWRAQSTFLHRRDHVCAHVPAQQRNPVQVWTRKRQCDHSKVCQATWLHLDLSLQNTACVSENKCSLQPLQTASFGPVKNMLLLVNCPTLCEQNAVLCNSPRSPHRAGSASKASFLPSLSYICFKALLGSILNIYVTWGCAIQQYVGRLHFVWAMLKMFYFASFIW